MTLSGTVPLWLCLRMTETVHMPLGTSTTHTHIIYEEWNEEMLGSLFVNTRC